MNRSSRRAAGSAGTGKPSPLSGPRLIETLLAGWRPLARLDVDGLAIARSRGITRRANSAVALEVPGSHDALTAAVDRVEALYEAAAERARFRVFDGAETEGLDTLLAQRGYIAEGRCDVLELPLTSAKRPGPHPSAEIRTGALDEAWFEAAWRLAPRPGEDARSTLRDIVAGTPAVQVALPAPGTSAGSPAVAVGRAALVPTGRSMAAVLNMIAVADEHRREGLGRAVSETLLAIAPVQGAQRALLEVETDNRPAQQLYRQLGFRRIAGYHYRTRP